MPTGTFALNDCYISLNGTDRSSHIKSVQLTVEVNDLDQTDFADAGWTVPLAGLKSGSLALTFNDSMENTTGIDAILWPLLGTTVAFEVRASNAAVGTTNPKYSGSVLVNGWSFGGSVGELAEVSVTFPLSGAVTRATA
jgi:hypothetical protein